MKIIVAILALTASVSMAGGMQKLPPPPGAVQAHQQATAYIAALSAQLDAQAEEQAAAAAHADAVAAYAAGVDDKAAKGTIKALRDDVTAKAAARDAKHAAAVSAKADKAAKKPKK